MFSVQEFTATLAVGGFVISVFSAILYATFGPRLVNRCLQTARDSASAWGVVGAFLLSTGLFGIGMLAEDISDNYVDTNEGAEGFVLTPGFVISGLKLKQQDDLRFDALFREESKGDYKPTPIARELARRQVFSRYASDAEYSSLVRLEKLIVSNSDLGVLRPKSSTQVTTGGRKDQNDEKEDLLLVQLRAWSNNVYFFPAKNTINLVRGDELDRIQTRIDFARSIGMSAALLSNVAIVMGLLHVLLLLLVIAGPIPELRAWVAIPQRWLIPVLDAPEPKEDETPSKWRRSNDGPNEMPLVTYVFFRNVALVVLLISISAMGKLAYEKEEGEFNKRAFGYFATLPEDKLPDFASDRSRLLTVQGVSGMANLDAHSVLTVHDAKNQTSPRLSVYNVLGNIPATTPVDVDWSMCEGPPFDVEAICRSPIGESTFWLLESGLQPWGEECVSEKQKGRAISVQMTREKGKWHGKVVSVISLPKSSSQSGSASEFEGIGSFKDDKGDEFLLWATRGGKDDKGGEAREVATVLSWAKVDTKTGGLG
ncbi:MAG: hypothetical protein KDA66_12210, partial [Planctomycetaceae bacterium]|nr:hypothetical protein [Planctomycetaceae bacterium]